MKIKKEFSKQANNYDNYNIIQTQVAHYLTSKIPTTAKKIFDLGSGSGAVYKNIHHEITKFVGIDFSESMCNIHPKNENVTIYNSNFDDFDYSIFHENEFDIITSASALQWSNDFSTLLEKLFPLSKQFEFAIFTSNTFFTMFEFFGIESPIKSADYYKDVLQSYNCNFEIIEYKLTFENTKQIFEYIKKSGVSGGEKRLTVKDTRRFLNHYPHDYLDFEVLFISFSKS